MSSIKINFDSKKLRKITSFEKQHGTGKLTDEDYYHARRRGRRLQSPQIFAKVDLLPIDNDSEKKDEARPCNVIPVMNKTNFD